MYKYDVSVPATKFAEVVEKVKKELGAKGLMEEGREGGWVKHVIGFGHVGDGDCNSFIYSSDSILSPNLYLWFVLVSGNLHLNVITNKFSEDVQAALEPFVFEVVGKSPSLLFPYLAF